MKRCPMLVKHYTRDQRRRLSNVELNRTSNSGAEPPGEWQKQYKYTTFKLNGRLIERFVNKQKLNSGLIYRH